MYSAARPGGYSTVPAGAFRYLSPRETLVIVVRQHPILLVPSYVTAGGGMVAAWFAAAWATSGWVLAAVWAAAGFLVARSVFLTANWMVQWVVITRTRVLLKSGLLNPRVTSTPIQSLENVTLEKSLGGSVLQYAALASGETGETIIDYLPYPDQLYLEIKGLIDAPAPLDADDDLEA